MPRLGGLRDLRPPVRRLASAERWARSRRGARQGTAGRPSVVGATYPRWSSPADEDDGAPLLRDQRPACAAVAGLDRRASEPPGAAKIAQALWPWAILAALYVLLIGSAMHATVAASFTSTFFLVVYAVIAMGMAWLGYEDQRSEAYMQYLEENGMA